MLKELVKVANKLDALGLTKEADIIDALLNKKASMEDEAPPIDIETLKKAYEEFSLKLLSGLVSLEVIDLYWTTIPNQGSCYVVKSEGKWDDGSPFNISSEIWPVSKSFGERVTLTVEGTDGKTYYLYTEY